MGKKLRNFLTAFIAGLGLVILAFSFNTEKVQAAPADYGSTEMVTSGAITNQNKDYGYGSNVGLTYTYDSSHLNGQKLQGEDTLTIAIPDELIIKQADSFPIYDNEKNEIGTATLTPDRQLQITFSDAVNDMDSVKGSITLDSYIGVNKDLKPGNYDVDFPTVNGDQTSTLVVRPASENDISKKGTLGTDEDGNAIVTWTILANRNQLNLNKLQVYDGKIDSKLTLDPDSIVVQRAVWKDKDTGVYTRKEVVDNYTVTKDADNRGFTIDFDEPAGDNMYAITFKTTLNNASQATDGTVFKNNASMNGSFLGNGSEGGLIEGNASANVSGNANSGNGNGDKLGSVVLTKKSADDENTLLPGATYSLYKKGSGSDTLVQSDLTTDANGQITVGNLSAGDYYFVETEAPDGYQNNTNRVPFNITGKSTAAVSVETKDEPTESQEGSIVIEKIDSVTGWRLPGAKFDVIKDDGSGTVVGQIETDQLGFGHMYNLPFGDYILRETEAPDGYTLSDKDIKFTVGPDNQTPAIISVENVKTDGIDGGEDDVFNASMIKYDADIKNEQIGVPGAEYTLYDAKGNELSVFTTNEDGVIQANNLKPGSYYFLETKAPEGYELNDAKIHFTITDKDVSFHEDDNLITSDPQTNGGGTGEPGVDPDGNGEEPDVDPDDNDNNGEKPGIDTGDNNNNNGNEGGLITSPVKPDTSDNNNTTSSNNNSNGTNNTLPQTGAKSSLWASIVGLFLIIGLVYNKRRHA